jgi:hypothetical protein
VATFCQESLICLGFRARYYRSLFRIMSNIKPKDRIPVGLSHEASAEAWYAFSDVLSWSRTAVERLKRQPADRKALYQHSCHEGQTRLNPMNFRDL